MLLIPQNYRRMIGNPLTSQVRMREERFKVMPARIQKVLEEAPERLAVSKKFDAPDSYLSVFVDLYDAQNGKAYMIEKPAKASDYRHSAFLS